MRHPSSIGGNPYLPHAVLADDEDGRRLHLHVAPLVDGWHFTSGFGWRQHPMGGGAAHHSGPHLHFEIRRKGWALDPLSLSLLPHGS